ncbi:MAG: CpaF family protein, partial [Bdellovibrionota bacterium]
MRNAASEIQGFLLDRGLDASSPEVRSLVRAELNVADVELEEFFGHGPLANFLLDESVTEILVNGHEEIWVERAGKLEKSPLGFGSEESLRRYARRLLSQAGRKVDHQAPFADATMADGSRLHVAAPPVAKKGFCLSIRKFSAKPWTLERLVSGAALNEKSAGILRGLVQSRKNILVAGGTGTGKTSLLGALLGEVNASERTVLLEDIAEIKSGHPHLIGLEARPPNQEGEGEINLKRLLREALRM